jgi:hypothetical protein
MATKQYTAEEQEIYDEGYEAGKDAAEEEQEDETEEARQEGFEEGVESVADQILNPPVTIRDDEPIFRCLEAYGVFKVNTDAHNGQWRCRAWSGKQVHEASHANRSTAAAMVLVKVTEQSNA